MEDMEDKNILVEEELDSEVDEGQHAETLEQLPEGAYDFKAVNRGAVLEGKVVRVSPEEILIDVGWKYEGTVSRRDLESMGPDEFEEIEVGDEVLAYVVNPESKDGQLVLSLRQAEQEKDWRSLEKRFEDGEVFEATVTDHNKGGLIVQLGQVRGFVPASQLVRSSQQGAQRDMTREERRAQMVGQELALKIIELDRERNRLILSERAATRIWRKEQKEHLLATLKEGDICTGRVSSLCDFGAFVDLGGADGLIHVSELSWGRVSHAREVLQVGDEIEVYVMNVDRDKGRIGLSLKQMQPDPWTQAAEKYTEGQLVEGAITNVTDFGAFARLEGDDIEGLIHVSELSDGRVDHPKEVVKKGDTLALRILRIEPHRRRMALSLKSVAKAEYADLDWRMEQAAMLEEEESEEAEETPQAAPVDEDEAPRSEKLEAETEEDEGGEEDLVEVESEEIEQSPEASSAEDSSS